MLAYEDMRRKYSTLFARALGGAAAPPYLGGSVKMRRYLFTDKVEPDDTWGFTVVEMALDRVSHVDAKLLQRIGFCKDGMTERTGRETALGGVFNEEYQFVHFVRANGL
jgi:hypothetical protein